MRLAQLARKLAIRPTEIVEFLTERNIQIDNESNTRLEDEHVALIMQEFAPARAAEVAAELVREKESEIEIIVPMDTPITNASPSKPEETNFVEPSAVENESLPEKIEVIKAPKVELSGLKVLGKIELPEPKKKEAQPQAEEVVGDQTPKEETPVQTSPRYQEKRKQENRKPYPNKRESSDRPKTTNPIALQREREALEAEKRRRAQAEEEKEKRTQHYLKKMKVVAPTKSARLIKEDVEEMTPLAPVPKTFWGKFMRWLNS
jgi:hypothetical protein